MGGNGPTVPLRVAALEVAREMAREHPGQRWDEIVAALEAAIPAMSAA